MKKIFYILSIILVAGLLTACTNNAQPTSPTSSLGENTNLELNPGANLGLQTNEQTTMSIKNQADLTKEYSQAVINTSLGKITVKFYTEESPVTVNNFLNLAQAGFYNNTKFHRVIKDFMIQGGDPNSKEVDTRLYGIGGPGYKFADEINNHKLVAGSLAMANSGPNTNGSQFFIVTAPETPWLDGMHTNFGEVVSGMDVVHQIENVQTGERDIPTTPVVINSIQLLK
ncbi:MAG: peptidylprolyl isomerase [Patescibacteria group bacterium]|jgi:cyclophilin family peptidyl-prolyl cis-trans isomerase|nr:peptidylprolyl isomerase [bacterium]HQC49507.1 peptidylprolyl isomerase [bacterium]